MYCKCAVAFLLVALSWLAGVHPALVVLCILSTVPGMLFLSTSIRSLTNSSGHSINNNKFFVIGSLIIVFLSNPVTVDAIMCVVSSVFSEGVSTCNSYRADTMIFLAESEVSFVSYSITGVLVLLLLLYRQLMNMDCCYYHQDVIIF